MTHSSDNHHDDEKKHATDDAITKPDATDGTGDAIAPNAPRTTSFGWLTTPKFGSAGSGGAELEPGPERD